jgi:putative salt-induced outer membrane protein
MRISVFSALALLGFGAELAIAQELSEARAVDDATAAKAATTADVLRLEAQVADLEAQVAELEAAAEPEAESEEPQSPWSARISLGYLASNGNADSTSSTAEFELGYDISRWHHLLSGGGFGSSEDNETTAENYNLGWKSSYDYSEFNYAFGSVDWNKNRFSGYPEQTFALVGYGRRVLNGETFILNLEAGVGYSKQEKVIDDLTGATEDEDGGVGRLGGDFTWNFSDSGAFEQTLYASVASANTYWESVSRLRADLIGRLALGLSYTIQANSDVAPGIKKTDTFTAITLDYSY